MADTLTLTLPDQIVANSVIYLSSLVVSDTSERQMVLGVLARALPRANQEHPWMQDMLIVGRRLVEIEHKPAAFRDRARAGAHCDVARAVNRFSLWRFGLAKATYDAQMRKDAA